MASVYARLVLAVIISSCSEILAKVAPDYIEICPGLKTECLKENVQRTIPHFVKGIPSLGLNSTDPLHIDHISLNLPGDLKINFYDGNITGLRKCEVLSVKYENLEASLDLKCDIVVKGKYTAKGRVILFTIDGEGDAKIKTKNTVVNSKIYFEDKVRNGIEYREIKNIKTTYRFGDKVSFVFTNLFKGSPELSNTILAFLNENWEQVVEEFGRPVVDSVLQLSLEVVRKFFKVIPKSELIA